MTAAVFPYRIMPCKLHANYERPNRRFLEGEGFARK
jgi:hypothetical protein